MHCIYGKFEEQKKSRPQLNIKRASCQICVSLENSTGINQVLGLQFGITIYTTSGFMFLPNWLSMYRLGYFPFICQYVVTYSVMPL